ncbi:hypothetical protein QJQ45_014165 [Haematococcus lacustris]|nr:hypothetical protein QJQ45_014165 [Haematococcus lacustris]
MAIPGRKQGELGILGGGTAHLPTTVHGLVTSAAMGMVKVEILAPNVDAPQVTSQHSRRLPHDQLQCSIRMLLKKMGQDVLVGDRVRVGSIDWVHGRAQVEEVFPRTSQLEDPTIANVNFALLVFALHNPMFEETQVSRFLVAQEASGLPFRLLLNKVDLVPEAEVQARVQQARAREQGLWEGQQGWVRSWGYDPLVVSCQSGRGVPEVLQALQGTTAVVAGPSGAGKSSLMNALRLGRHRPDQVVVNQQLGWQKLGQGPLLLDLPVSALTATEQASLAEHGSDKHLASISSSSRSRSCVAAVDDSSRSERVVGSSQSSTPADSHSHDSSVTLPATDQTSAHQVMTLPTADPSPATAAAAAPQLPPHSQVLTSQPPPGLGQDQDQGSAPHHLWQPRQPGTSAKEVPSSASSTLNRADGQHPGLTLLHSLPAAAALTTSSSSSSTATMLQGAGRLVAASGSSRDEDQAKFLVVGEMSRYGKGKHTTTSVSLIRLPGGGWLADTPGFSQPSLDRVTSQDLASLFPEFVAIAEAAGGCRFANCHHVAEPGCPVTAQPQPLERYPYYLKFLDEIREREERDVKFMQAGKKARQGSSKVKADKGGKQRIEAKLELHSHRKVSRTQMKQSFKSDWNKLS